jgi:NAD(P)-dependent dehydrogenase (short-subunit alcohol dehydrogenase family)
MSKADSWLIIGTSTGLGRALAAEALGHGALVAAITRNQEAHADFATRFGARFLSMNADIRDGAEVSRVVRRAVESFGHLDVVVYNVGYAQIGAVEELTDEEWQQQFDVNFFGATRVIRSALPHMRSRGTGQIFVVSSSGRYKKVPLSAAYLSSKHALVGLVDALGAETRPFGITVSLITPGAFRTNFARSLGYAAAPLPAYEEMTRGIQSMMSEMDGNQPGDAGRAAGVIYRLAEGGLGEVNDLILGSDALDEAAQRVREEGTDVDIAGAFAAAADVSRARRADPEA